jgi:hypothetical protein
VAEAFRDVRDGGDIAYGARAVLDPSALESIHEANFHFLGLLAARCPARGAAPVLGLPAALAARVRALGPDARRSVAACPYTLFNLRFEDGAYWRAFARDSGPRTLGSLADDASVARMGVFLAWHLAQSNDLAASLVLGLNEDGQRAWRGIPLSALDRAAVTALPFLQARWGRHPVFWPRLVECTSPHDRQHAEAVRLLGLQLLAADGIWPQVVGLQNS